MARVIRLKEQQQNRIRPAHPTPLSLKRSDGSVDDIDFELETDGNGFIKTGADVVLGRQNFFCVGGSFVESSFANPKERFVARAAHALDANIFNAGYSGMTLLQACVMIMTKLPTIASKGDTIILFSSQSDANASQLPGGYWNNNSTYTAIKPVAEQTTWEASFHDTHALLHSLVHFCRGMGFKLAFVISPYRHIEWGTDKWARLNYGNPETMEAFGAARAELGRAYRNFVEVQNIPCLDMDSELQGNPDLFYDELHFNARGQEQGGKLLTDFLTQLL